MMISPRPACTVMFRAISEIAVATNVASVRVRPMRNAASRPRWRATTVSASDLISTRISASSGRSSPVEEFKARFEIESCVNSVQPKAELAHGGGNVGLDPDDDGLGAAQAVCPCHGAQRPRYERVDDVERRDVDDHTTGTMSGNLDQQRIAQLDHFRIGERRLYRRDQVLALLEDRYGHWAAQVSESVDGSPVRVTA